MLIKDRPRIRCYALLPFDKEFRPLKDALKNVCKDIGVELVFPEKLIQAPELIYSEIARIDLIVADITSGNPNIFYEIGLCHALGKPVIFLARADGGELPFALKSYAYIIYAITQEGLSRFQKSFRGFLDDFIRSPRRFKPFLPFAARLARPPYIIDLEKLDPREFDNLCFELFAQMGFRRVAWGKEFKGVDVVATLPKKDPDGYEYEEMWIISMGRRAPVEMLFDMAIKDPEHFLIRVLRYPEGLEELSIKHKIRYDIPITVLFILRREGPPPEFFEYELIKMERRLKERTIPINIRIRWWDHSYLTNLVQQYPQIAFKYFSEEARVRSKYRKTPEELLNENAKLTEDLLAVKNQLEEEKKRRFIAERDAAWKDVAFKGAHKLGNPIDAIDTFLQSLKRRIQNNRHTEAVEIADEMDVSIEEAKKVIEQFKSLVKSQEITQCPTNIVPFIQHSCKIAEENGVNVTIQAIDNCPQVMVDPDRIVECFNELVSNALHWFDKAEKKIMITIDRPPKKDLPDTLDKTQGYLKIHLEDNGCGVPIENKEKIFAPFFTTYPHGTGLGLSLVKSIIESHGGLIYENGIPNEGASFEVYLPIVKKRRR